LQLKAFAQLMHFAWQRPVPLHRMQRRVLERIRAGRKVPHFELRGCLLTAPSLEDFALSEHENRQAQETDELASVSAYVDVIVSASFLGDGNGKPRETNQPPRKLLNRKPLSMFQALTRACSSTIWINSWKMPAWCLEPVLHLG
jgi:hypothetical protein